jgi:Zn finger protein HypA/HybF involved in hydrogenase expression
MKTRPSEMRCEKCDGVFIIHRKLNRLRPIGHKKKLWCVKCGKRTNHIEQGEAI